MPMSEVQAETVDGAVISAVKRPLNKSKSPEAGPSSDLATRYGEVFASTRKGKQSVSNMAGARGKRRMTTRVVHVVNDSDSDGDASDSDDAKRQQMERRNRFVNHQAVEGVYSSPNRERNVARLDRQSPVSGLTNNQITEQYRLCLDLNQKNKITMKNAFDLKLLDNIQEFVRSNDNFLSAGSAIDASSKIYGYRVDKVHQETYKVLGHLGKSNTKRDSADEDGGGTDDEGAGGASTRIRKRTRTTGKSTLEVNERNINLQMGEVPHDDDALFEKVRLNFDEGGSTGLLLNQIFMNTDGGNAQMHSLSKPEQQLDIPPILDEDTTVERKMTDLLSGLAVEAADGAEICPSLGTFEFLNFNCAKPCSSNTEDILERFTGASPNRANPFHAIDRDAAEIARLKHSDEDGAITVVGGSVLDQLYVEGTTTILEGGAPLPNIDYDNDYGLEEETIEDDAQPPTANTRCRVSRLMADPSRAQDFSYFDQKQMETYKGPQHWKTLPKKALEKKPLAGKRTRGRQKRKKESTLDFLDKSKDLRHRIENDFRIEQDKKRLALAAGTLNKRNPGDLLTAEQFSYDKNKLMVPALKPKIQISATTKSSETVSQSGGLPTYDYDNLNDTLNYCPPLPNANRGDDSFAIDLGYGLEQETDDDLEDVNNPNTNSDLIPSTSTLPLADDGENKDDTNEHSTSTVTAQPTPALEDSLVEPRKIELPTVQYSKRQKKIDARKLKREMLFLMKEMNVNPDAEPATKATKSDAEPPGVSFGTLLQRLPERLKEEARNDLSVPIAFVIALHLANENTLRFSQENLDNFTIHKG